MKQKICPQELKRERIRAALCSHKKQIDVAKFFNITPCTVHRIKERETAIRKTGSGRKTILTTADKIKITKLMKDKCGTSLRGTAKAISTPERTISFSTINYFLKKQDWGKSYKLERKTLLTEKNRTDRLNFADKMINQGWLKIRKGKNLLNFFVIY